MTIGENGACGRRTRPGVRRLRRLPHAVRSWGGTVRDASAHADATAVLPVLIRVGIVLVNDRHMLVKALAAALGAAPGVQVAVAAVGAAEGTLRLQAASPHVALVDSIPLAGFLHQECPDTRVFVIARADDPAVVQACIRAGAVACVDDSTSPEMLVDLFKRALGTDEVLYEPRMLLNLILAPPRVSAARPQRTAKLAERELSVLAELVRNPHSAAAAENLGITINTLRTHLKNILAKLDAHSTLDAILIALREGRVELNQDQE
ncbi:MAG: response regulator transcription factor [Chloroflexi bacterium]|nr:response regulator transcription factor [Chloroflexota bacterium]